LSVRILLISTCLTGALVMWGFNAGIVSVLTVETTAFPIRNLQVYSPAKSSQGSV
jgi:hypothetical protein